MQPTRQLRREIRKVGDQQNIQNQDAQINLQRGQRSQQLQETQRLTETIQKKARFTTPDATSSNPPFQQKKSDNTQKIFSPALSRVSSANFDQNELLFEKYPEFEGKLLQFKYSITTWLDGKIKSKDKNLKNYQKATNIFREYIENPIEGAKIDASSLNLEDLPENIEEALLPRVKLRLNDNKFRRLPLDLYLVDDDVRIRLEDNLFNPLEEHVIMLFTSYWKKHVNIYSDKSKDQYIPSIKGKEKGRESLTTFTTFGYKNAYLLATQVSNTVGYIGKETEEIMSRWRKRDKELLSGMWNSDEEKAHIFRRHLQYRVQRDNIRAMTSFIENDPKLVRFYTEYFRALKTIFSSAISLATVCDRADIQTQLTITQSAATGALTVGAMVAKYSGFPFLTGAGDGLKAILNFYQNHQFNEFNKKVNNFTKFIGFKDGDIIAFCETIARFITLSEYYHLQKYREKPQQGKIIKDPKGVPSQDKHIEERATKMMYRLLDLYDKYKDPNQEPHPKSHEQQEELYGTYDQHNIKIRDFLEQAMDEFYIKNEDKKRPIQKREYRKVFLIYNPKDVDSIISDDNMNLLEKYAFAEQEMRKDIQSLGDKNQSLENDIKHYEKLTKSQEKKLQTQGQEMQSMQNQINLLMQQMQNLTAHQQGGK